jgi:hypothetical protein
MTTSTRATYAPAATHFRDGRGVLWKMSDFCGDYVRVICGTWKIPAQPNAIRPLTYHKTLSPQH